MLAAVQGIIQNGMVLVDGNELKGFNGRSVTIIINDSFSTPDSRQDKSKFFDAVGKIKLDRNAVDELRAASMI